jgi:hypothetical protein
VNIRVLRTFGKIVRLNQIDGSSDESGSEKVQNSRNRCVALYDDWLHNKAKAESDAG